MTPLRPSRIPPSFSITGIPPPPEAITIVPESTRDLMASVSAILIGSGEGTTLLKGLSPFGFTLLITCPAIFFSLYISPGGGLIIYPSFSSFFASSSLRYSPTGFEGSSKSGSSFETTTCVITVATGIFIFSLVSIFWSVCWIIYPICPCVIAPTTSIGIGGTFFFAISCCIIKFPDWGPLPCVITTL